MARNEAMNMGTAVRNLDAMRAAMQVLWDEFPLLIVQAMQIHGNKSVAWINPPSDDHALRKYATLQSRTELGETEIEEIYTYALVNGVYVNWIDRKRRLVRVRRRARR